MNRHSIGTICGFGLVVIVACTGGGSPNDFGVGASDDAPTDPGAPSDPNAPPGDPNQPPFGDVAPPGNDQPPGGIPPGTDCTSICNEVARACPGEDSVAECVQECREDIPGRCLSQTLTYVRCLIRLGCDLDQDDLQACEREVLAYIDCVGPGGGEGGQGGQ